MTDTTTLHRDCSDPYLACRPCALALPAPVRKALGILTEAELDAEAQAEYALDRDDDDDLGGNRAPGYEPDETDADRFRRSGYR